MILIRSAHPGIMSRNLSAALAKSPQQPFHELSNSRAVKQWCTQKGGITDINSCKRLKQRVSMCESLDVQSAHTLKHSDGDPYHHPLWLFEQHRRQPHQLGHQRDTSSRKPRFKSESREVSSVRIVLQNRRGPTGFPCCGASSDEMVYWP